VTKLDRLARSVANLVDITRRLEAKGVALRVLDMGLDTATPQGRLMLNVLGSIAQFERELMLERQREGIARAKAEGKYKGRVPTAQRQAARAIAMRQAGQKPEAIAKELGISRASVFRVLKTAPCTGDHFERGSSASRRPSPSTLNDSTVMKMAMPG
jgi:DNA invertase Pin-like site-specific DNA recombinase